jgi:16S rRNA (guanine527-N7)-methyltransferase
VPVGHQPDFPTFAAACQALGITLSPENYQSLVHYVRLIELGNKKINLISRRDTARIFTYHIIDSLAACRLIPKDARCADIGSGAGLPGIPIAIVRPDTQMLLVESIKKKCHFLELAVSELGLKNTIILPSRAEELPALECDIILSRLTATIDRTLRYCHCHLVSNGLLILYKSANWQAEMATIAQKAARLNLHWLRTEVVKLPFTDIPRYFVLMSR